MLASSLARVESTEELVEELFGFRGSVRVLRVLSEGDKLIISDFSRAPCRTCVVRDEKSHEHCVGCEFNPFQKGGDQDQAVRSS